jgi:predicted DNA-binding transcriptional regulator AlpA
VTLARRHIALPPNLPPRGLRREEAASYVGISPSKFDALVRDGRMPGPLRVDSCAIWDRLALDRAFDRLNNDDDRNENEWDSVL